jgi:hypothetical protein
LVSIFDTITQECEFLESCDIRLLVKKCVDVNILAWGINFVDIFLLGLTVEVVTGESESDILLMAKEWDLVGYVEDLE